MAMPNQLDADFEGTLMFTDLAKLDENAIDVAFGIGEIVAPAGSELASEIPILRTLIAIGKTATSISTALLTKKVVRFLTQLGEIDAAERERFIGRLEGKDRQRIIDELLLVLDRHETQRKSEIQGKLFAALIRKKLTPREYLDLTHATSAVNVEALDELVDFYRGAELWESESAQAAYSFAFLQLVGIDNSMLGTYGGGSPKVTRIGLGEKYVEILTS